MTNSFALEQGIWSGKRKVQYYLINTKNTCPTNCHFFAISCSINLMLTLYIQNVPHRQEQFLNIYSAVESGNEYNLDSIARK